MQIVPIQAIPNQTLQAQLANQPCTLNIYQTAYGLFMDVLVNNEPIIFGVIAENLNRIVRSVYLGFIGDFVFFDTQGQTDPVYTGLGSRYLLIYLAESDLPAGEG
jgi:hypothetical protein